MEDFEGSVDFDGSNEVDIESTSEEASENINNSEVENTEEVNTDENTVKTDDVTYTDRGTKLDTDPKSAYHQKLANAESEMKRYQEFLQDPKAVKQYLEELEAERGETTGESRKEIREEAESEDLITDPDKIETAEDLKSYVKFLAKGIEKTKQELEKERQSIRQDASEKAITERLTNDINSLQNTYAFLRPTNSDGTPNPQFDAELEKEIADQYEELDKDQKTGMFLGKISIKSIAERAIRIRKLGEATGSKNAQTIVLDKRAGAIKTGGNSNQATDESKMSATQLIASRMAKVRR